MERLICLNVSESLYFDLKTISEVYFDNLDPEEVALAILTKTTGDLLEYLYKARYFPGE